MKIAIIGVGLIGGSIALKLREKNFGAEFIGIDKSEIHLQEAQELGIIDRFEDFEKGIKNADTEKRAESSHLAWCAADQYLFISHEQLFDLIVKSVHIALKIFGTSQLGQVVFII